MKRVYDSAVVARSEKMLLYFYYLLRFGVVDTLCTLVKILMVEVQAQAGSSFAIEKLHLVFFS